MEKIQLNIFTILIIFSVLVIIYWPALMIGFGADEFGLLNNVFIQHTNGFVVCATEQSNIFPQEIKRIKITTSDFSKHYLFPTEDQALVTNMNILLCDTYKKGVKL